MQTNLIFYAAFLSQLLLVSLYLPQKMRSRIRQIIAIYPQSQFPHLYPEPVEKHEKALRSLGVINLVTCAASLVLVALILSDSSLLGHEGILTNVVFPIQVLPLVFMEITTSRFYKLMRQTNTKTKRTALLQPRRFLEFVSPSLLGSATVVYLAFVAFVIYINQFDYPWFGGYVNVVGVTAMNIFFGIIIARKIHGKKINPHQSDEDRNREIQYLIKQMLSVSIAGTVYITIAILLGTQEWRHLQPLMTSIYYQLIAIVAFRTLPGLDSTDDEVYKDNSVAV